MPCTPTRLIVFSRGVLRRQEQVVTLARARARAARTEPNRSPGLVFVASLRIAAAVTVRRHPHLPLIAQAASSMTGFAHHRRGCSAGLPSPPP